MRVLVVLMAYLALTAMTAPLPDADAVVPEADDDSALDWLDDGGAEDTSSQGTNAQLSSILQMAMNAPEPKKKEAPKGKGKKPTKDAEADKKLATLKSKKPHKKEIKKVKKELKKVKKVVKKEEARVKAAFLN